MEMWQRLWEKITQPAERITDTYDREQNQLASAALFMLTTPLVGLIIGTILFGLLPLNLTLIMLIGALLYSSAYAISRLGYSRWGVRVNIWTSFSTILWLFVGIGGDVGNFSLTFLAVPLLLAGFFLKPLELFLYYIPILAVILVSGNIISDAETSPFGALLLLIQVGAISAVASLFYRRYQQSAIDNEARYRDLMNANYEGIFIIDRSDAKILDVNPAVERILGYPFHEICDRYPIEFVTKADKDAVWEAWHAPVENIPYEARLMHKQGYPIDAELRIRSYQHQGKNAYVLTMLDITDRKQAESLIIESEERFRAIFNASSHYIGVLDAQGRILELNDPAYDVFGYRPSDVLGHQLWDFDRWAHSPASKNNVQAAVNRAQQGESVRQDIQARNKHDEPIYLDFSLTPLVDDVTGETKLIIAESRDMTAYHRAEAERHELENRYRTLFKNTTDAVFIINMDGIIKDANERATELLDMTYDDLIGSSVINYVIEEQREVSTAAVASLREGGTVSNINERRMVRRTGEVFDAETIGIKVETNDGKEQYILSMVRDISDRKRMERQRFETQLAQERTDMLAHFIENASHHFRTPITNMKTRMYLLPRVIDRPEKRQEQIVILNQELERLQNIINDLLQVLKLQREDRQSSMTRFTINELLVEVRQSFEGRNVYANFEWKWLLNSANPFVWGDRQRLSRAMIKLVDNAITYTPSGGSITLRSFNAGGVVAIEVQDTGDGIQAVDLPHIFDDFYRGQDAMEEDSTSSGLGLTIVKLTVERHDGKIFVQSSEGEGTTFQIVLPIFNPAKMAALELPDQPLMLTGADEELS